MTASSTRPYMIRAIYEWCNDNGFTPYIAVMVDERTVVPLEHVRAGEIVLNLSASATNKLTLGNDLVHFHARFSGVVRELSIPVENITAIYARENGHGMAFEVSKPLAEAADHKLAPTGNDVSSDAADKVGRRISPLLGSVPASPTPGSVPKSASVTSLPGPRPRPTKNKVVAEIVVEATGAKEGEHTSVESTVPPRSTEDDTNDPNHEPSGPGQRTGGRNGTRGRAKLTRIK